MKEQNSNGIVQCLYTLQVSTKHTKDAMNLMYISDNTPGSLMIKRRWGPEPNCTDFGDL
jgi:hypothetical protein